MVSESNGLSAFLFCYKTNLCFVIIDKGQKKLLKMQCCIIQIFYYVCVSGCMCKCMGVNACESVSVHVIVREVRIVYYVSVYLRHLIRKELNKNYILTIYQYSEVKITNCFVPIIALMHT